MIKVNFDWIAASASLSVGGVALVIFLCLFGRQFANSSSKQKKSIKNYCPLGQDTLTKYSPLTLLSQPRFACTGRYTLIALLHRRIYNNLKTETGLIQV
jgi:hypothetical protein